MLSIGFDPEFTPISFTDDAGEADGRAVRLLRAACERAGVACRFVPVALAAQEARLVDGTVDAIAVMAATPERRARYGLSEPYLITGAAWFALKSSGLRPFDPGAAPAAIATPATGPLVRVVAESWPHLAVLPVSGYREALDKVAGGEAAAAALNFDAGKHMCEVLHSGKFALPEQPFLEIPLAVACRSGSQDAALARLFAALGRPDQDLST